MAFGGHAVSHAMQKMQSGSLTGSDLLAEVGCPGLSIMSNTRAHKSRVLLAHGSQRQDDRRIVLNKPIS
jgi:hypothetical protein